MGIISSLSYSYISFVFQLEVQINLLFFRCFDKAFIKELLGGSVSKFACVINRCEIFILFRTELFSKIANQTIDNRLSGRAAKGASPVVRTRKKP